MKICENRKSRTFFDPRVHILQISNISLKSTKLFVNIFVEPPGAEGTKICSNSLGQITNMLNYKYSSPETQLTDKLETWYVALDTCSNDDLQLTLTLFTARLNMAEC